jgi:hypothetical protein
MTGGSVADATTKSGNNSALPFGIAYLGTTLQPFSSVNVVVGNQTRVLKSAASGIASALRRELDHECYTGTTWHGVRRFGTPQQNGARTQELCALFNTDLWLGGLMRNSTGRLWYEGALPRLCIGAALVVVGFIAGCGPNQNFNPYTVDPPCYPPNGVQVSLIYPAPNASNVPSNFGEVILASSTSSLPYYYRAYVSDGSIQNNLFAEVTAYPSPSPFPSPFASPVFTGPPFYQISSSPGVTWPASSMLSVYLGEGPLVLNNQCQPALLLGSFTIASPSPAPPGAFSVTPVGGATAIALASLTQSTPYAPPSTQTSFALTVSEAGYSGKFTPSIVYLSQSDQCYSVTMDATSGTVATFVPVAGGAMAPAGCTAATPVPYAGNTALTAEALFEDTSGNVGVLYFGTWRRCLRGKNVKRFGLTLFAALALCCLYSATASRAALAGNDQQCQIGQDVSAQNICAARWEAANMRAHLAAGQLDGSTPQCLRQTAGLLEGLATKTFAAGTTLKDPAAWPCGSLPKAAKDDDGVLSTACPAAVWTQANYGLTGCDGEGAAVQLACSVFWSDPATDSNLTLLVDIVHKRIEVNSIASPLRILPTILSFGNTPAIPLQYTIERSSLQVTVATGSGAGAPQAVLAGLGRCRTVTNGVWSILSEKGSL